MFLYHLHRIIQIVHRNFQLKKKSDDYELFLGKSGKNYILGPSEEIKVYQEWVCKVFKFHLSHLHPLFDQDNLELLLDAITNDVLENSDKVQKDFGFLGQHGQPFSLVHHLANRNHEEVISIIKDQIKDVQKKEGEGFSLGLSLNIIAEFLRRNQLLNMKQVPSFIRLFEGLKAFIIIREDQIRGTNHLDDLVDSIYESTHKVKPLLENIEQTELLQLTAVLYGYVSNLSKMFTTLSADNETHHPFITLLLATVMKQSLKHSQDAKITDSVKTLDDVHKSYMHSTLLQTSQNSMLYLTKYMKQMGKGKVDACDLWASLSYIPLNASVAIRGELARQFQKRCSKILKFIKIQNPLMHTNFTFVNNQEKQEDTQKKYKIFKRLVQTAKEVMVQEKVLDELKRSLEHALISMIDQENGQLLVTYDENTQEFKFKDDSMDTQKQNSVVKSYKKLTKIILFLRTFYKVFTIEEQFQPCITQSILSKDSAPVDHQLQLQYLKALLTLSLFDKYSQSQFFIKKALCVLKTLLASKDLQSEEGSIKASLQLIKYQSFNRQNKQILSQVLDKAKSLNLKEISMGLENLIFSEGPADPLGVLIKAFEKELFEEISSINVKEIMEDGDITAKKTKMMLLERCQKLKDAFGISFDYSLCQSGMTYKQRPCIYGISDDTLIRYQKLKQKQEIKRQMQQEPGHQSFRDQSKRSVETQKIHSLFQSPARQNIDVGQLNIQCLREQTPKRKRNQLYLQGELNRLVQEGASKLNKDSSLILKDHSVKRKDSEIFENQECTAAKIFKVTLRRNSAKRQFNFQGTEDKQQQNAQQNSIAKKGGHRKGQMSMNPSGANFNFRNQRLVDQNYTTQQPHQHGKPLPPGLPKAGAPKKPKLEESKVLQQQVLSKVVRSKDDRAVRIYFNQWKQRYNQRQIQSKNDKSGSFNLILVKKEGENLLIKEGPKNVKKIQSGNLLSKYTASMSQVKELSLANVNQEAIQQKIQQAKPFEFIRVKNSSDTHVIRAKIFTTKELEKKEGAKKKQKMTKQQYQQFLTKFQQISAMMEKVQKDADNLNNEFSKMN